MLDGHALELKRSTKRLTPTTKASLSTSSQGDDVKKSKLIIRNIPFQVGKHLHLYLYLLHTALVPHEVGKKFSPCNGTGIPLVPKPPRCRLSGQRCGREGMVVTHSTGCTRDLNTICHTFYCTINVVGARVCVSRDDTGVDTCSIPMTHVRPMLAGEWVACASRSG